MRRTPSALSWKLANFARLDPALKRRNIAGASHGSRAEIDIWNEFRDDWDRLAFESESLLQRLTGRELIEDQVQRFPEGATREAIVRVRVNQTFFRSAILAAYDSRCCITGIAIPELLNASHIVPWAVDMRNRTNPSNGLCLNVLHDRAFDCGLLTVTPELKVRVSPKIVKARKSGAADEFLGRFDGLPISAPRHFYPDQEFLRYHNERVFLAHT